MNDFEKELGNYLTDILSNIIGRSVTPLNGSNERKVTQWGTGTYILVDGMRIILTCRHVITDGGKEYGFFGSQHVTKALGGIVLADKVDAAMIHVPEFEWDKVPHEAHPVPIIAFAEKHDPVPKELFYVMGFGEENTNYFDE